MNETECEDLIKSVKWTEPANLISLAILEFINVLVIGGNCLVIAAVFCSNKLRSVTNFFIVNLAVADLLVGLAVLPFSATWEVFKVWIFGDVWCRIWLAVDVWMCTASILNLCAISLDRYVAVTRPVTYPSIMSTKKAKSLIAGIWVLSFVICFPPLVGWKDQKAVIQPTYSRGNSTLFYATTMSSSEDGQLGLDSNKETPPSPASSSSPLPSHLGSGHAYNPYDPDFAPIDGSAEIRIAAMGSTSTTAAAGGSSSTETTTSTEMDYDLLSSPPHNRPQTVSGSCPWKCELTNDRGYVLYSALGSFYIPMFVMLFFYWRIYRAAVRTTRAINQGFKTTKGSKGIGSRFEEQRLTLRIHRGRGSNQQDSMHSNGSTQSTTTTLGTPSPERLSKYATRRLHHHDKIKISVSYPSSENISELAGHGDGGGHERRPSGNALFAVHYNGANGREATESQLYRQQQQHGGSSSCYLQVGKALPELARRQSNTSESGHSRPANKKMGRRNIKAQVKRFRMETKAAKTLAIIVGMFIFCWCPFFTMYIIRPFCQDCIDPLLFSVLFWLGYCNSAVNPMIYALFSKDFRFAFKRIICRCFCSRQSVSLKSSRRGSDMSAIRIRARTPSITPSAAAHSFGDESELHHSEMSNDPR
ncbi:hypothetical protein KR059_005352 [Drosophila kikkawai]|nr:hypothetical protein KR059_005352 [Drosophila kikkawai]